MAKIKKLLTKTATIIAIMGVIGFSLFITEEAYQCTQFGTWQAIAANDWPLVMEGVHIMESINSLTKTINYTVGWLNPLSFFSYRAYSQAADYYVKALSARAFANAPELFVNKQVSFSFIPGEIRKLGNDKFKLISGKLGVITLIEPTSRDPIAVTGILIKKDNVLLVDTTDQKQTKEQRL
jgi:hypothetical protein